MFERLYFTPPHFNILFTCLFLNYFLNSVFFSSTFIQILQNLPIIIELTRRLLTLFADTNVLVISAYNIFTSQKYSFCQILTAWLITITYAKYIKLLHTLYSESKWQHTTVDSVHTVSQFFCCYKPCESGIHVSY